MTEEEADLANFTKNHMEHLEEEDASDDDKDKDSEEDDEEGLNGKTVDGRTLAVDWAVDKRTWEEQHGEGDEAASAEQDKPAKEKKGKEAKKDDLLQRTTPSLATKN
ncbi:hypothetical protein CONLIGDRAFT_650736 [Coniochaeta ligniaria NRRL 30616]|uniref:Uncharacterized protein n=1 Tax=Coniochaeta ligniaria NRRL 30616 TaxID=1408157 RepID=A0A1J7I3Y1_9PEZI|nr:hypothetical protein CONLIGDRAFT_650736 [Coniochaeta ligniaria NRRL 30616]